MSTISVLSYSVSASTTGGVSSVLSISSTCGVASSIGKVFTDTIVIV